MVIKTSELRDGTVPGGPEAPSAHWHFWGCGAVGSARDWQSRGHGFESRQLHQNLFDRDPTSGPVFSFPPVCCPSRPAIPPLVIVALGNQVHAVRDPPRAPWRRSVPLRRSKPSGRRTGSAGDPLQQEGQRVPRRRSLLLRSRPDRRFSKTAYRTPLRPYPLGGASSPVQHRRTLASSKATPHRRHRNFGWPHSGR